MDHVNLTEVYPSDLLLSYNNTLSLLCTPQFYLHSILSAPAKYQKFLFLIPVLSETLVLEQDSLRIHCYVRFSATGRHHVKQQLT